ncbi:unnamed protein product, partial [marine sediment metagenome]
KYFNEAVIGSNGRVFEPDKTGRAPGKERILNRFLFS